MADLVLEDRGLAYSGLDSTAREICFGLED